MVACYSHKENDHAPFVLRPHTAGRSENQIKRILDVTHEVMVNAFNVPERDRYQIVREHLPSRMILEDTGLGIGANCLTGWSFRSRPDLAVGS